jgi:hypothetical protein
MLFSDNKYTTYGGIFARKMSAYTEELEVTVLEKAALDPTLFEVPFEYKQVERSQKRLAE